MGTSATNTGGTSWGSYVSPEMIQGSMDVTKSILDMVSGKKNVSGSNINTPTPPPTNYQNLFNSLLGQKQKDNEKTDNTMKYMLIGGGVLVFIVLIFILKRR